MLSTMSLYMTGVKDAMPFAMAPNIKVAMAQYL
jgi:hypothetical protein